jgi:hypothetical protein
LKIKEDYAAFLMLPSSYSHRLIAGHPSMQMECAGSQFLTLELVWTLHVVWQALKAQDAILRAANKGMYSWKNSTKGKAWAKAHGNGNGNSRKLQAVTTWSGPVQFSAICRKNGGTDAFCATVHDF